MAKEKKQSEISTVRRAKHGGILTVIFAIVSFLWISPILIVFLNSFKRKAYIFTHPFSPSANSLLEGWDKFVSGIGRAMCGWLNYSNGIRKTNLWGCFGNSLFITVGSVALIILCCSMTAYQSDKSDLCNVPVFYDRTFPDGNVYTVEICKYPALVESGWYYYCVPWFWSGTCGIYVYRFRKKYLAGNRGSSDD